MFHFFKKINLLKKFAKLASNLPLEPWLQDYLQNLTNSNQLILNLKYGNVENAKLISGLCFILFCNLIEFREFFFKLGALLYDAIVNIRKKVAGSKNEIYLYSVVS